MLEAFAGRTRFIHTRMSPNASPPPLIDFVPIRLKDMLIREASLALTRQRLTEAIPIAQAREQEVRATRSPFMVILPTKANQEFRAHLEDSRQTLDVLQKALGKLTAREQQLLSLVSYRLETHLRRSSKDYINGLASYRYPDDWLRIKTRLEDCISTYHEPLKTLSALCLSIPAGKTVETTPACHHLAIRAIAWGERLEDEVRFINKIADVQRAHTGPGGFTLKRQTPVNWKECAQALLSMNTAACSAALENLIPDSEAISKRILADVSAEQQLVLHSPAHGTAHFHAEQWTALRAAAWMKVNPTTFESLTQETETLLENGEFEAWSLLDEPAPAPSPSAAPATTPSQPPFPTTTAPFAKPVPPPTPRPGLVLKLPSRIATQPPFTPPKS